MKYYVINYKSGEPGCPSILKGAINRDWSWDHLDPDPDQFEIENDYIFKAKTRFVDFDYWSERVMGSEQFTQLIEEMGGMIRKIPVKIIYPDQSESCKKYFYILWKEWYSIIDLENSEYIIDKDLYTGEKIYNKMFPNIFYFLEIHKFAADKNKDPGKHIFKSLDFFDQTICSEEFMKRCIRKKFKGVSFTPVEEAKEINYLK